MEFGKYKLKRCRYGWMLYAGPYIGKSFDIYGEYSESEVQVLRQFLKPGDTVIDIGANIGDLTVPMAQFVGPTGVVYAVESHPESFNVLCANLALNNLAQVRPVNCFLRQAEDAPVRSVFVSSDPSAIEYRSLDSFNLRACNFIKIDVDGNERDVLASGIELIRQFRPVIYAENDVRPQSRGLLSFLTELDYQLYWHLAPIFNPNNFFGTTENIWNTNIISIMVLAAPAERKYAISGLRPVRDVDDWWDNR